MIGYTMTINDQEFIINLSKAIRDSEKDNKIHKVNKYIPQM